MTQANGSRQNEQTLRTEQTINSTAILGNEVALRDSVLSHPLGLATSFLLPSALQLPN